MGCVISMYAETLNIRICMCVYLCACIVCVFFLKEVTLEVQVIL